MDEGERRIQCSAMLLSSPAGQWRVWDRGALASSERNTEQVRERGECAPIKGG